MKRILVLGAGLVARPLARYLLDCPDFRVRVASRTVAKARELIAGHPRGEALAFDMEKDAAGLPALLAECDLAVSLLPWTYHVPVAEACVAGRKHLVTTSYVQPAMRALDGAAQAAGVILLNEMGLDPGIDHLSAMRVIQGAQRAGARIESFTSYCGGLPAPEANTNPFGYKFSWSPRGVLLAGRNAARFLRDGAVVEIAGPALFEHHWPVTVAGVGEFEGYPNRNALPYLDTYGIGGAAGIFRGTLRYPGWCETLRQMVALGLLDDTERDDLAGVRWARLMVERAGGGSSPRGAAAGFLGMPAGAAELERMAWLGLFEDAPLPAGARSVLDALAMQMQSRMAYASGERDMIILQDTVTARYAERVETITSTLLAFGEPDGDTAMSRTVSLPAAIAVRLILQGKLTMTGVRIPVHPEIYAPALEELESLGVRSTERVTFVDLAGPA